MKLFSQVLSGIVIASLVSLCGKAVSAQSGYLYGLNPGQVQASFSNGVLVVQNDVLAARWSLSGGKLRGESFETGQQREFPGFPHDAFVLLFRDGRILRSSSMKITGEPRTETLAPNAEASRAEEHFAGKRVAVDLEDQRTGLTATWAAILRDGDNYLRQEVSFSAANDLNIKEVRLFEFSLPGARVAGEAKGSPVTTGDLFFGFEHPLSQCAVNQNQVRCALARELPLKSGQHVTYSSVIGVAPSGQMRRAFLNYIERERAHPYRPILHYNSWYDLGFGKPYDEAAALDAIHAIGDELTLKRHVKLDSFMFDDGWDDPHTLWSFHSGFPDGFAKVRAAAAEYSAAPGIWLSPWGGYNEAKTQRLKFGVQHGYETNAGGFALSGPKYFARFRQVTLDFIHDFGINQFKIDGTGNVNSVFPGSEFDSDFHAAISLINEWRRVRPDIFVNLTSGTFPSPFWLLYADSIWRSGEDHSFTGVGPWRERWITYRDAHTYSGIVRKGRLFPLNSLMLHGIIYGQYAEHLADDPEHAFQHEVRSYFGSGTQLQEMYITPSLFSEKNWDDLAEAANWARRNAAVLVDTHWVGGDPEKLQVYGWAAWSPEKGILTLRNPSDHAQGIAIDPAIAFELPSDAVRCFEAHSPWNSDKEVKSVTLIAGKPHTFMLRPFEVLTLETVAQE